MVSFSTSTVFATLGAKVIAKETTSKRNKIKFTYVVWHLLCCRPPSLWSSRTFHSIVVVVLRPPLLRSSRAFYSVVAFVAPSRFRLTFVKVSSKFHSTSVELLSKFHRSFVRRLLDFHPTSIKFLSNFCATSI
jgi:hypothetical protein